MTAETGYHPNPSDPSWQLPKGSCDTHCHVFGPPDAFPYDAERTYTPATDAPKEKLFALHRKMGLERCVVVQAGCHGFDNSVVADTIKAGGGNYLGVALAPVDSSDADLRALRDQGFRGVRFNFMRHLGAGASISDVVAMTPRLAEAGLHLQVHMESSLVAEITESLNKSAVTVVIDHMGRVDASLGTEQPAFAALRRVLTDNKNFWVKVSGSDRLSKAGPPYADATPFAATLVSEVGDRVLWGTDWPHPNISGPVPDDGKLVDLIAQFAPEAAARQALLVDNPARLYGFE